MSNFMSEGARREAIRLFGEGTAEKLLPAAGFTNIKNLNRLRANYRRFDLLAEKDGRLHIISVKFRNHTFCYGAEKTDVYNLYDSDAEIEDARRIAQQHNAIPTWITGTINAPAQTCSVYWGLMDELQSWKSVPMRRAHRARHRKLAEDKFFRDIDPAWTNNRNITIALMHCIPAYADIDELVPGPQPVPVWAWSWVKHPDEQPTCGDSFCRADETESYDDCLEDMWSEAGADCLRFIRDTDGSLRGPLKRGGAATVAMR